MTDSATLLLRPPNPGFSLTARPPGSKSLTNRALLLAALAPGESTIEGCLEAEDTTLMQDCLESLGVGLRRQGSIVSVQGTGAPLGRDRPSPVRLQVGTAGTVARFLTAALAGGTTEVVLDGSPRMRERPMAELLAALRAQGANIECERQAGFLPVRILPTHPGGLAGGEVRLGRLSSSQFPSALIFAALGARATTRIVFEHGTPARPYVDMTLAVVRAFGGRAQWSANDVIVVEPGILKATYHVVEPDASSASYLLTAAAVFAGQTTIRDLGGRSLQGDARFVDVLAAMGARTEQTATLTRAKGTGSLKGIDVDLSEMPDMALTLAVAALHARGPTTIRGVSILRHHESDRLAAAAAELTKLGARVEELADGLRIQPPADGPRRGVTIHTYRDHRMAMAFALAGDVAIEDPTCVGKTYPAYFTTLSEIGMVSTK